jgi:uncharacterized protein YjbI with pentapeptide repeats
MSNTLDNQREYSGQTFKRLSMSSGDIAGRDFHACIFEKCAFLEADFEDSTFNACAFRGCDLSLAKLKNCAFTGVTFEDCKMIGINWTTTAWGARKSVALKPVDFVGCTLNYSIFLGLNLRQITLSKCVAHDASFEDANMTLANCSHTDFAGSRFMHTNLTEADFTGASNYDIDPTQNTLKKAKFALPEAISLLRGLGIVLNDAG